MRKLLLVVFSLLLFGSAAMAQSKINPKWHCPKQSADHKFDVGDEPDHSYMILQGSCDATSSDSGFAEKKVTIRNSERCGKHPRTSMAALT